MVVSVSYPFAHWKPLLFSSRAKDPVRKVLRPSGIHTMVGKDGKDLET